MKKIPFIITIDTEGDNLWSKPKVIETKNTEGLYRFQELCNKYGFKPVYLTNYEMVMDDKFVEFGKLFSTNGQCEIGMHLHAWNSPPEYNLTKDDYLYQPFLCEYPTEVIEKKVGFITELLRNRFSTDIVSHRAGRWAMSDDYIRVLKKNGYLVDCSVTPGVDWSKTMGDPEGNGGTDYSKASHHPHWIGPKDCSIFEVPMTINQVPRFLIFSLFEPIKNRIPANILRYFFKNSWLRPAYHNIDSMKRLCDEEIKSEATYLEFMIHSSELSVGLNPNFENEESIEQLYEELEILFSYLYPFTEGCTLKEFYDRSNNGR